MTEVLARLNAALDGRYRLERELGAGGMATVYLAEDLRHGRRVALKVLRPELAATLGSERFFREIQVAARLQHPHILPLHDSGEAGGFLYFVMPYVEGESLRERLARVGELPVHDAVKILVEVVDALAYAHQQGVVHRDIKPDNVMLSGRHALVTDFGVAKAVSEATGRQQLTTAGVALGTPSYMAPEQAAADPNLDHRVDIYAVGAMAYELLTGRPPFTGMTSQQILAAHVTQAPDPVSRHRPTCPPGLEAVIMRCLAKRAADRWQSAEELLQQLEPLATPSGGMTPTQTRPVSAVTVAAGPRRSWLAVAAAGTVLLAASGWYLLQGREAPPVALERIQLTSTGNAGNPAISADGRRIAYLVRNCGADGRCTMEVVAQDVDGGGVATVARGFLAAWGLQWSGDGRYLLVLASRGPNAWGAFSVPVLGGEPRLLGCCFGSLTRSGDSVLISRPGLPGDSASWVRRVSLTDGAAGDSFAVAVPPGTEFAAVGQADEGRVIVAAERGRSVVILLTDAQGHPMDSIQIRSQNNADIEALPDGRGFLLWSPRGDRPGEHDLVRYRVSRSGRIAERPDTVLRQVPATARGSVGRNGALVYGSGPTEYIVRALRQGGGFQWTGSQLLRSTTFVGASLFGDGAQILLYRYGGGAEVRTQFSLLPFDSGPEVPLGPPIPMVDFDPSQDGRSLVMASPRGADSVVVSRMEIPSARSAALLTLPARDFVRLEAVVGGGILIQTGQASFRTFGIRGVPDTTWQLPDTTGSIESFDPSPDGRAAVTLGWDLVNDSVVAYRVSFIDGSATRLASFGAEGLDPPRWLADGTVLLPILESTWTMTWFRMPAAGGAVTRLGPTPHFPATYRFSLDGSRALERQSDPRPDVYLVPNFGEVLKR